MNIAQLEVKFKAAILRLPPVAGAEVVNFALDNFRRQGFAGQAWKQRKNPTAWGQVPRNNGRALLVDKGDLKRSPRVMRHNHEEVVIGSSVPYAKAQNEGFSGQVVQTVTGFQRKNGSSVKSFSRTINQDIPARPFLANSPVLEERLKRVITEHMVRAMHS